MRDKTEETPLAWSASKYLTFEDERTRPARDLLAHVSDPADGLLYDLGCGPGNSTELIAERFPDRTVRGIDSDDDMLQTARKRLPGIGFHKANLEHWTPEAPAGLLFANAVFQWVPDHLKVLDRLMNWLSPGGTLAVQMPDTLDADSHVRMETVARSQRWQRDFEDFAVPRAPLPPPSAYIETLDRSAARVDVWHTTYYHRLENAEAIVEWVAGTGLRPYLAHLPAGERNAYRADYLAAITQAFPAMGDGRVLLPFKRLFVIAIKAG